MIGTRKKEVKGGKTITRMRAKVRMWVNLKKQMTGGWGTVAVLYYEVYLQNGIDGVEGG